MEEGKSSKVMEEDLNEVMEIDGGGKDEENERVKAWGKEEWAYEDEDRVRGFKKELESDGGVG